MCVSSKIRGSFRVLLFIILGCGMGLSALAQPPTIHLTGVMQSGEKSIAYVEGTLYQVGELLPSGHKVEEVLTDGIRVSNSDGEHFHVPIGNPAGVEKLTATVVPEEPPEPEESMPSISIIQSSETPENQPEMPENQPETPENQPATPSKVPVAILIVSIAAVLIGAFISTIAEIWYIVACFQESIWWGLGALFLPFVSLFFLFMHWDRAKKPFLMGLIGALIAVGGVLVAPAIYL